MKKKLKRMKVLGSILMTAVMVFGMAPVMPAKYMSEVQAEDITNTTDDGFQYQILTDDDGEEYAEITGYVGSAAEITIPDEVDGVSVTSIGVAFVSCHSFTSVIIPNSITNISSGAFVDCFQLASITVEDGNPIYFSENNAIIEKQSKTLIKGCKTTVIPRDITSIGDGAFQHCWGLTSIVIPGNVKSIGGYAFCLCDGLTNVTISNGVENIGEGAFGYCSSLTSIAIPNSVTSIDHHVFGDCYKLASITVESGNPVYYSENNAIIEKQSKTLVQGCKTTVIPSDITSIGWGAFNGCSGLTSIIIPSSVENIDINAFTRCSGLTSITIPSSVTRITCLTFTGCSGLTSITVESGNPVYVSENNAIIEKKSKTLIAGCMNTIIPNTVTRIGEDAFWGCRNLSGITIPNSVKSIGEWAFGQCYGLTSITIPNSVTSIEKMAFYSCYSLTSITIPSSVTSIGKDVFWDGNENLVIHTPAGSVAEAYAKENNIKYDNNMPADNTPVTPPQNSTEDDAAESSDIKKPASKGTTLQVTKNKCKVKVLSSSAKNPTVEYTAATDKKAKTVSVPSSVTVNGVTYKVTSVKASAFKKNKNITKVTLGKNVTSIGKNAFYNCTSLKTVEIKATGNVKIGAGAFSGCKKLMRITIKSSKLKKSSVGKNVLKGTNKKLVIKVPKKQVKSYKAIFKNKGNKTVQVKK